VNKEELERRIEGEAKSAIKRADADVATGSSKLAAATSVVRPLIERIAELEAANDALQDELRAVVADRALAYSQRDQAQSTHVRLVRERDEALADLSNTEAARAAAEHAAAHAAARAEERCRIAEARAEERCRIAEARAARFKAGLEALCWMAVEAAS